MCHPGETNELLRTIFGEFDDIGKMYHHTIFGEDQKVAPPRVVVCH